MDLRLTTEVKQETDLQVRGAQVAKELLRRGGMQLLRRFDLESELFIDDHVERLPGEWLTSIVDRYRQLAINPMSLGYELSFKSERIDVFAKTESELSMNIVE
ncbi:MAG: hypothetical protein M3Y30_01510 [Gemmatimonadota bacterium]|nr:hypothetical protein [Gemmatimonadota bacterium]